MSSFKSFQDDFQKAILKGDADPILGVIPDSPKESKETLLNVYQHAYSARLTEFLQSDYEKLYEYLGHDSFAAVAEKYAYEVPSNNPNGRWFGTKFPEYLAKTPPCDEQPQAVELAELERALNDMFDAAEEPILKIEQLANVAAEDWGGLVFQLQPATCLLKFKTNAVEIWSALHKGETPPQPNESGEPIYVLCYRQDRMSKFRILQEEEAILWNEAGKGTTFAGLCEIGATYGGEEEAPVRVATYLNGWIQTGLLVAP